MENIHIVNTGSWSDDFGFKDLKDATVFYELVLKAMRLRSHYINNETYFSEGEKRQVVIKSNLLCTDKEIANMKEEEASVKETTKEEVQDGGETK